MPAFAPIEFSTYGSGGTVTGAYAFEPVVNNGAIATFADASDAIPQPLKKVVTVSNQKPTKTSRVQKGRQKLVVPTQGLLADGITGSGVKDREVSVDINVLSSERSTPDERIIAMKIAFALAIENEQVLAYGKTYY